MADKLRGGSTVGGNIIWHSGNDGAGSGLDADVLDGLTSSQFVRSDVSDGMVGDMTITGTLVCSGDITANSDKKLKDNIEIIQDATNKIKEIDGVTFTRNDLDNETRYTGVIAQKVQKVLPEAVRIAEDGTLSVAYGNMIGLLIEAIKEQNIKMDKMQTEIDNIKGSL